MSESPIDPVDPWTSAMLRGDFAAAWDVSDRVLQERLARQETCWDRPRHEQFVWRGGELAKRRVLVRCYHGLGDTLQFVRFAAPLRHIAREVTLWVQPTLMSIVATAPGVDRVSPLHEGTPELLYDIDIEIMELPHALRVTTEQVSSHVPYLFPRMRSRLPEHASPDALRVGIVWRGGDWAPHRNIDVEALAPLREIRGVELYSLQYGATDTERATLNALDYACKEIELLGSRMQQLDLVISVDTYTTHLAGGMGSPVWTLLPTQSDWRWMRDREDSPWYPNMRLFRQSRPGDWSDVIRHVADQLEALADSSRASVLLARRPWGYNWQKPRL